MHAFRLFISSDRQGGSVEVCVIYDNWCQSKIPCSMMIFQFFILFAISDIFQCLNCQKRRGVGGKVEGSGC